jgi:heme-degrading monooxygenase HmoA
MFARFTIVQFKRDRLDEAIKLFEESVVPAVKSQKGFQGVCLLVNREMGQAISVGLFDTEEEAILSERSGYYQEQLAKFREFFTAPPAREGYEVACLHLAEGCG